jgi:putative FmdB family regulatory protein
MPTYEYVCDKCGHTFDVFQSITAQPLEVCPKDRCARRRWGRGKVHRAIAGGAGLIFKGSGFYITDYRSEAYKSAAKREAPASGPSGATPPSTGGAAGAGKTSAPAPNPAAKTGS